MFRLVLGGGTMSTTNTEEAGIQPVSAGDVAGAGDGESAASTATIYASATAASNPYRSYEWQLDGYLTPGSNQFGANGDLLSTDYSGAGVHGGLIADGFARRPPDLAGRLDLGSRFDPRGGAISNIMPDSTSNVHGT